MPGGSELRSEQAAKASAATSGATRSFERKSLQFTRCLPSLRLVADRSRSVADPTPDRRFPRAGKPVPSESAQSGVTKKKTAWWAIRSEDQRAVAEALALSDLRAMGWPAAVGGDFQTSNEIAVTPSIDGWVCVLGSIALMNFS